MPSKSPTPSIVPRQASTSDYFSQCLNDSRVFLCSPHAFVVIRLRPIIKPVGFCKRSFCIHRSRRRRRVFAADNSIIHFFDRSGPAFTYLFSGFLQEKETILQSYFVLKNLYTVRWCTVPPWSPVFPFLKCSTLNILKLSCNLAPCLCFYYYHRRIYNMILSLRNQKHLSPRRSIILMWMHYAYYLQWLRLYPWYTHMIVVH